jgi:hypothetical protein
VGGARQFCNTKVSRSETSNADIRTNLSRQVIRQNDREPARRFRAAKPETLEFAPTSRVRSFARMTGSLLEGFAQRNQQR